MRIAALLATAGVALISGGSPAAISQRDAKLRTFRALLAMTEQRPDSTDATHAAITIGHCSRAGAAYLCGASLTPVAFSGIDGSTCSYVVTVSARATRIRSSTCS